MASIDNHNSSQEVVVLNTTAITAAATTAGNQVNILQSGEQYESIEVILLIGAMATAPTTLSILVQEADLANFSDAATVDPSNILGDLTVCAAQLSAANTHCRFGYIGNKTYIKVSLVSTGTASFTASGVALLQNPRFAPTAPSTAIASVGY
jgi:hypothetical protein